VTELSDGEIRLETLAPQHLEGLAALGRDPDVQRFTYVPSPWEEGFERTWLERYEEGTRAGFAIVDEAGGDFLGLAALVRLDRDAREAEAGYTVLPQARGRGIAGRALGLLTDWAFAELGLERIELRIGTDNPGSIRLAERCGYTREGVLRNVHFKHGLRADVAAYSLLRGERSTRS
jgi:[ribosomal protein S5]-alanine N-acetyltransferase